MEAVVAGLVTVDVGLVVVRVVAEEEVVGREVEVVVAGLVRGRTVEAVLGRVVDVLFSAVVEPAMLERRSRVEVVDLTGALVADVPTSDMRLAAVLEMPRFSSPELATDRWDFSSAELLTEARDRWPAVVVVVELKGLRTVVVVVAGRVGGLFRVLPLVAAGRVVEVVVLEGPDMEVGRLVVVVPDKGRLVLVVEEGLFLTGEALTFSLSLETSGLVTGSSLPERMVESTGVAGGAISGSTSAGATGVTGSSVDAMLWRRSSSEIGVQGGGRFAAFDVV